MIGCLVLAGCDRLSAKASNHSKHGKNGGQASARSAKPDPQLLPPPIADPQITLFEAFDATNVLRVELGPGVNMEFVRIPPGMFRMGDGRLGNRITITKPYHIGRYEVTQEQWQAIMGSNPSRLCLGAKHPVERVDWDDCQQFLGKMNERCAPSGRRFALPSEAQWEYAARAGNDVQSVTAADPDFVHTYGWIGSNSENHTHPVGQRKPNGWGLYDMQGNVAEWCADATERDDAQLSSDVPAGASPGEFHAVRGGNWRSGAASCLPSSREVRRAAVPLRFDGLRLICEERATGGEREGQ